MTKSLSMQIDMMEVLTGVSFDEYCKKILEDYRAKSNESVNQNKKEKGVEN